MIILPIFLVIISCSNNSFNNEIVEVLNDRETKENEIKVECRYYLNDSLQYASYCYLDKNLSNLDQMNSTIGPLTVYGTYTIGYFLDRDFNKPISYELLLKGEYEPYFRNNILTIYVKAVYEKDIYVENKNTISYLKGTYSGYEMINNENELFRLNDYRLEINEGFGYFYISEEEIVSFDIETFNSEDGSYLTHTFTSLKFNDEPISVDSMYDTFVGFEVKGKNIDGTQKIYVRLPIQFTNEHNIKCFDFISLDII